MKAGGYSVGSYDTGAGRKGRHWTPEAFLSDARRLEEAADPASLLRAARSLLSRRIDVALADPASERLGEVAKTADIAEKWYSDADRPGLGSRTPAERMAFVERLVLVALQRGLIAAPAVPTAQIVDATILMDAASDKGDYDTLPEMGQLSDGLSKTLDF